MTTTQTEAAPVVSTAEEALRRVQVIRTALEVADEELVKAYARRDWDALGYSSWESYCAAELPGLKMLKLRAPVRKARAVALRAEGATIPEIVAATGSSLGAIHRDLNPPKPKAPEPTPPPAPVEVGHKTVRAVALIAAAGADGLDVRQVAEGLRCERHEASATLTRLVGQRRIEYREPKRRGLFGRYVVRVGP